MNEEIDVIEVVAFSYGFTLEEKREKEFPNNIYYVVSDCKDGLNELWWEGTDPEDLLNAIKAYFYDCGAEAAIR